ncbi:MAG: N-acetyl-alpha-D-glucosaminyl L-malate synthase BshA [Acidobacteriota bacterium]
MNLGIVCYPTYGGSGVIATELGQEMARRGHNVHFISYSIPQRLNSFQERIFFHEVEIPTYPLFQYPPYSLALATKIAEVAEYRKLELLHVHYAIPHATSAFLAREIPPPKRFKIITTLHGTDITVVGKNPSYLPVARLSMQKSDGITAVSHYLKQTTIEKLGVTKDIEVVPNFVDTEKFHRESVPLCPRKVKEKGEKVLIHISNFRPLKRLADVVEVFYLLREAIPCQLLLVGDGPERAKTEQLCRQKGIISSVHFLGKQNAITQLLNNSDLMLLPSEIESFGLVALEAMACEVPVIATKVGGLPEVVIHGEVGFLCEVGDIKTMYDYSLKLLQNESLRREMGLNGRQRVLDYFSLKSIVERYEQYYIRILQKTEEGR